MVIEIKRGVESATLPADVSREGLISVPLTTRPKPGEIPGYLSSFQAFIIEKAISVLSDKSLMNPNAFDEGLSKNLQRLITALSTETDRIRIPIVWAALNKIATYKSKVDERTSDELRAEFGKLLDATSIFLSHFDLARHLTESEARVKAGDDRIDEALFVELSDRVMEFDKNRAEVFSDLTLRTNKIAAVLNLSVGVTPATTYLMYRVYRFIYSSMQALAPKIYAVVGLILFSTVLFPDATLAVSYLFVTLLKLLGLPQ